MVDLVPIAKYVRACLKFPVQTVEDSTDSDSVHMSGEESDGVYQDGSSAEQIWHAQRQQQQEQQQPQEEEQQQPQQQQ